MARIVVVGAGMAGMAVAARLAVLRHEVTLCERAPVCGGALGSLTRDGFTFTTGPGVLTLPAVYRDLFLKTGAALEETVGMTAVESPTRCSFAPGNGAGERTVVDIPNASRAGTHEAFEAAFGQGAGDRWQRLLHRAGEMWGITRKSFIEAPLLADPPERAGRPRSSGSGRRELRTTAPWRSLRSFGRSHFDDPRMRAHLERFALEAGCDPRRAPATVAILPYLEETFGLWWARGGLHTIAEALHARCLERRVTVRTGTEVRSLVLAGDRVAGVTLTDGGRLDADVVITGVPAETLYGGLLPGGVKAPPREHRVPAPSSVLELHLALRGRTIGMPHRTCLFPDAPEREAATLYADRPVLPSDPTLCVLAPDDPAMAPEGHEAWTVQVRVPRHGVDGAKGTLDWTPHGVREAYTGTLLGLLARRGLDVRERLLWSRLRTPADLEAATGAPGGAVHGVFADGPREAGRRLPNRWAPAGLYSVGAAAHPGGGLPRVGMSAALVADLIGRD